MYIFSDLFSPISLFCENQLVYGILSDQLSTVLPFTRISTLSSFHDRMTPLFPNITILNEKVSFINIETFNMRTFREKLEHTLMLLNLPNFHSESFSFSLSPVKYRNDPKFSDT